MSFNLATCRVSQWVKTLVKWSLCLSVCVGEWMHHLVYELINGGANLRGQGLTGGLIGWKVGQLSLNTNMLFTGLWGSPSNIFPFGPCTWWQFLSKSDDYLGHLRHFKGNKWPYENGDECDVSLHFFIYLYWLDNLSELVSFTVTLHLSYQIVFFGFRHKEVLILTWKWWNKL